jgi:hypothetical protein
MGSTIQRDNNGIWVMQIFGALRKEESDAVQAASLKVLSPHENPRVLIMVEDDFCGWVGSNVWNGRSFLWSIATGSKKLQ